MNSTNENSHLFLKALRGEEHKGVPCWFMRQAGRYLPGYQKVRSKVDFLTLCKTPDLAAEVTLEPLELFGVDATIIFSDILVPLEAMGLEVVFGDRGPCMANPLDGAADVARLSIPDPVAETGFVMDIVREVRKQVAGRVPVIGFAGAPFTLACYALEGSPSRTFEKAMKLVYEDPKLMNELLGKIADTVALCLRAQVEAGAQAVQLFDTWGGLLAHDVFKELSLAYCMRVLDQLKDLDVPRILFIKGAGRHLEEMSKLDVEALGVDYTVDPAWARDQVAGRSAIQGNLPPQALFGTEESLREKASSLLNTFSKTPGYVFNLGHGILPKTPVSNVHALVDEVRKIERE